MGGFGRLEIQTQIGTETDSGKGEGREIQTQIGTETDSGKGEGREGTQIWEHKRHRHR